MEHNYQDILEHLTNVEKQIKPEKPFLSEQDITMARMNYAFEIIADWSYQIKHNTNKLLEHSVMSYEDREKISEKLKKAQNKLDDALNNDDKKPWDIIVSDALHKDYLNSIDDTHFGSCVAMPFSCARCAAEDYFNIKNTATWTKEKGSKLYSEYMSLVQQKKKIELAVKLENNLEPKNNTYKTKKI